jgi:hypothetical protein
VEILVFFGMGASMVGGLGLMIRRFNKRYAWMIDTVKELRQHAEIYYHDDYMPLSQFIVQTLGQPPHPEPEKLPNALLIISEKRLALYVPYAKQLKTYFGVSHAEIQGFWRPVKYNPRINEMWIHCRIGDAWHILKIRAHRERMYKIAGALKRAAPEEQVIAYRRHRPYIHRGLSPARIANQTLQGAWEMLDAVDLYLMPLQLVLLQGGSVQRQIPLTEIQDIAALPRLDAPEAEGLIRFTVTSTGEKLAFAVRDYQAWADDLAHAARRTLEAPVIQKQKGYDDEEMEE